MKIKICGMKHKENIIELAALKPDMMGFIFYKKSLRYVDGFVVQEALGEIDNSIIRTGVFVNAGVEEVVSTCKMLGLQLAQLHGGEDVAFCREIKGRGIGVIKVFSVGEGFDLEEVKPFVPFADYFLFDTKTKAYGGSGKHFDWSILKAYHYETPFMLSGGISENDLLTIKQLGIPQLAGIDVNSRLEIEPGLKDLEKARRLIDAVRK